MLYRRIEEEWSASKGLFAGVAWQREVEARFLDSPARYAPGGAIGGSARLIADLGEEKMESILPGGPSEKPLSRLYGSEIRRWFKGHFKTLIEWNDQQSR